MIKLLCLSLLATLLFFALAHAEDRRGRHEILGVGNRSCGDYLILRNPNPYEQMYGDPYNARNAPPGVGGSALPDEAYIAWMDGYLSAFNQWVGATYSISGAMAMAELRDWLVQYCLAHRQDSFQSAAAAFVSLHFKQREQDAEAGRKVDRSRSSADLGPAAHSPTGWSGLYLAGCCRGAAGTARARGGSAPRRLQRGEPESHEWLSGSGPGHNGGTDPT